MDNKAIITDELKAIGSGLSGMPSLTPYRVPEAYFQNFPQQMLQLVREDAALLFTELEKESILSQHPVQPGSVPEGYFDSLPGLLLQKVKQANADVREELEQLSPVLAGIGRRMPYSVPEGYFDTLVDGSLGMMIPGDPELSAELQLGRHTPYRVPENYFAGFPALMLQRVKGSGAKVISMSRFTTWRKLAVAALVAGILFIGSWWFTDTASSPDAPTMANLEEISLEELELFAEGRPAAATDFGFTDTIAGELEEEDFQEFFAELSDQELQLYLADYTGISIEMIN